MRFEVLDDQASAITGRNSLLTSQLAMPSTICLAIFPNVALYTARAWPIAKRSSGFLFARPVWA